jgi:hypothetical protein
MLADLTGKIRRQEIHRRPGDVLSSIAAPADARGSCEQRE